MHPVSVIQIGTAVAFAWMWWFWEAAVPCLWWESPREPSVVLNWEADSCEGSDMHGHRVTWCGVQKGIWDACLPVQLYPAPGFISSIIKYLQDLDATQDCFFTISRWQIKLLCIEYLNMTYWFCCRASPTCVYRATLNKQSLVLCIRSESPLVSLAHIVFLFKKVHKQKYLHLLKKNVKGTSDTQSGKSGLAENIQNRKRAFGMGA